MVVEALRGSDRPDPCLPFRWGDASGRRIRMEPAYSKGLVLRGRALPRWGGNLWRGGRPEAAAARTDTKNGEAARAREHGP